MRQSAFKELPFFSLRIVYKKDILPQPDHAALVVENSGARIFNFKYKSADFKDHSKVVIIEDKHGTNMGIKSDGTQSCFFPIEMDGTIGELCSNGCSVVINYILESGIEMEETFQFPQPYNDMTNNWFAIATSNRVNQTAYLEAKLRC